MLARVSIVTAEDAPEVLAKLATPGYKARVERGFVLRVEGFDWNCPQHITPRFSQAELVELLAPMRARLEALERENSELRAALER